MIRILKKYNKNYGGSEKSWKEVIYRTPIDVLKQLALATKDFFNSFWCNEIKVSPLHIVAVKGTFELCQFVMAKVKNKNPEGKLGLSCENLQKVIKIAVNKPTIVIDKITILHVAAMRGNSDLCKLIMNNVTNLNPKDSYVINPIDLAAGNGHLEVLRMIMDRIEDKNPACIMVLHHFILLLTMVIWIFADSLLRGLRTKILQQMMDGHHYILLLNLAI